eukprot:364899-Chlamydomonas_euryale.AAC.31
MAVGGIGDGQNCATCLKACPAEHAYPLLDAVQLDPAQLLSAAAHWLCHHQYYHHLLMPHHRLQSQAPVPQTLHRLTAVLSQHRLRWLHHLVLAEQYHVPHRCLNLVRCALHACARRASPAFRAAWPRCDSDLGLDRDARRGYSRGLQGSWLIPTLWHIHDLDIRTSLRLRRGCTRRCCRIHGPFNDGSHAAQLNTAAYGGVMRRK